MREEKKETWSSFILRVFLYALLFGGGLALSVYLGLILFQYYLTSDILSLPDFRNQSLVEAINQMSRLGLQAEIKRIENNPEFPSNWVIQQDPPPGVEVKKNHRVKLVINGGEGIAEGGSISGGESPSFSASAPTSVSVPDVRQMSLEEAQSLIESSSLKLERVAEVTHDTIPAGYVVSQNPPPESRVAKGSVMSLLVSKGKSETEVLNLVVVPDLVGLRLEEAKRLLAQSNLTVGNVEEVAAEGRSAGVVVGQSPAPGEEVEPGEKIHLQVTKPEEEASGLKELSLRFVLPSSRNPIEVKVVVTDELGERVVYEKEHQGEEMVELNTSTKGEGRVVIYLNGYYYWDKTL
ncbi:MAG TPA: PASTA domain-containing protein [Candidatus Atribacteria bacterium]|nr:PASTA domain-containing protein [Candidatus Atribacteria bacterium]